MTVSFEAAIEAFAPPGRPLAVALSGGADSTALLVACADRWPGEVRAIHVHHGLQPAADDFAARCEALCAKLGVPLEICAVNASHARGESPEDAARNARYAALHSAALRLGTPVVALAQHADDQVETVLLALSRGAGIAGLAGMRPEWERTGATFCRPLLGVSGAELRRWLGQRGVSWVEDPTNNDERFTRNRIRARLVPALGDAFPSYRDTFARSARHAAQAQALLDEVAAEDLARIGSPPALASLRALTRARQANVLRWWLREAHGQQPSTAQLDELLDQVAACTTRGHRLHLKVGQGWVVREGDRLQFDPG